MVHRAGIKHQTANQLSILPTIGANTPALKDDLLHLEKKTPGNTDGIFHSVDRNTSMHNPMEHVHTRTGREHILSRENITSRAAYHFVPNWPPWVSRPLIDDCGHDMNSLTDTATTSNTNSDALLSMAE